MDNKLAWHICIQWLASKGLLHRWLIAMTTHRNTYTDTQLVEADIDKYIQAMPSWLELDEGYHYWSEVSNDWRKYLRDNQDIICRIKV